jgi:ABC-2 type transport system ATP-binding protein
MKRNIIEVNHLTKMYGELAAVDDISFNVEEGSIFAFLGPNGAGKTTTINTLCTIQDKTGGDIFLNGHDISREKNAVRADIGIVFQDQTLDTKLTVEQNLDFHCRFYKVPKSERQERIDFVLDLVDLSDWKKAPVAGLSGGMKRRVEIARGLIHFPKVLFLDEPTAGLDPQTRASVWDYIRRLQKEKSITIFLTTHYMDEAEICSSVAIIDHGKIAAFDTPDNLKDRYTQSRLKIRTANGVDVERYLTARSIRNERSEGVITAYIKDTDAMFDVLCRFRDDIDDFEVNKGSLNDVFLAVTGREIRE